MQIPEVVIDPQLMLMILGLVAFVKGSIWPEMTDQWKPAVAVGIGMGYAVLALWLSGAAMLPQTTVSAALVGLFSALSAMGLYSAQKAARGL